MSDEAKAVQAVAESAGKGIDLTDRICGYFAHVMQVPVAESTGMLADYLKFKRFERQIALVEKTKAIIGSKPSLKELRAVPPKIALPIFYGASIEEDEDLHTIWARLLASAMDPDQPQPRVAFADILRQMDSMDVVILSQMHEIFNKELENGEQKRVSMLPIRFFTAGKGCPEQVKLRCYHLIKNLTLDEYEYQVAIDNLKRLGLCNSYISEKGIEVDDEEYGQRTIGYTSVNGGYHDMCLTSLGLAMIELCNYRNEEHTQVE
ncbi:MAG: Abi-alpha family protein [Kiritimatiellae bacterium]|jgi:hypothetical protein|nr:Abi-alpha family protein [Kiritimatiellia bacterium]